MGVNAELDWAVQIRSFPGAPRGGDAGVVRLLDDGALLTLLDASGHGLPAYAVAQTARKLLLQTASDQPEQVLAELHEALAGGLGAAVSIARLRGDELLFAGVGNVSASVNSRPLLVRPGVVGQRMCTPRVEQVEFGPGARLLMYTDGVSTPDQIPPGDATTAARALIERYHSSHDDAGVLVARRQVEYT